MSDTTTITKYKVGAGLPGQFAIREYVLLHGRSPDTRDKNGTVHEGGERYRIITIDDVPPTWYEWVSLENMRHFGDTPEGAVELYGESCSHNVRYHASQVDEAANHRDSFKQWRQDRE